MKVLLVTMKHDYGDPTRGLSYADDYFTKPMEKLVDSVVFYDFMAALQAQGRQRMNQELLEMVQRDHPDVAFFVPFTDQLIPAVIDEINKYTTTVGYYFDDTWRIEYSRFWAGHFRFVTTSDVNGVRRWRDAGCSNFIYSPFACSHEAFRRKNLPKIYDVSFVGQCHPYRAWCLRRLAKAGFKVHAWGYGWASGRLSLDGMVDVFNQSKINLNLTNSESWDSRYLLTPSRPLKESYRAIRNTLRTIGRPDAKNREMVKARHFEINACGGFQLSYYVEGLERHYQIGREIALYESPDRLVDEVGYYLRHEEERETIASSGYDRTRRDHSLEQRFADIFDQIGLTSWRKG
ncbi:MAG: glycosyltransferase [Chloroflexi bacterium]|nr:glycosyltransferase [Chloroflexota bacterium]